MARLAGTGHICKGCGLKAGRYGQLLAHEVTCPAARFIDHVPQIEQPITEAEWQRIVIDFAEGLDYLVCHIRPVRVRDGLWVTPTSTKGFPDLWITGHGLLAVVELKRQRHTNRRPEQEAWIAELAAAGVVARFARPSDLPDLIDLLGSRWQASQLVQVG